MIDKIIQELDNISLSKEKFTENGATMFATTNKSLLDINFKIASYRSKSDQEIINDFLIAFNENAKLAIKWLFFIRDVREGLGERRLFRVVFKHLLETQKWGNNFKLLLFLIPIYGRWDDCEVAFYGNSESGEFMASLLKEQIEHDIELMNNGKSISLCAKWMPSEGATSLVTKRLAKRIAKLWGINFAQYRRMINPLKKYLQLPEIYASANQWDKILYEKVCSRANIKYAQAFMKHDFDRRQKYIQAVAKGEKKINSSVNFPHDVLHMYTGGQHNAHKYDETIEQLWKALPKYELSNTLVVADGSGSMTTPVGNTSITALDVANALAIYCSERNKGEFANKYITFSSRPQYVKFDKDKSLYNKIQIASHYNEVANTNIESVFDLILKTACDYELPQSEMIKNVLIISDMEFDSAVDRTYGDNLFKNISKKYQMAGYRLPRLVFWNVNSRTNAIPIQQNENGVALVSGFSPAILKMVMSDVLDPWECLLETLLSKRYEKIVWGC